MVTLFLFISSTHKFKAFSNFLNTLSRAKAVTSAICGATEKLALIFSLFLVTSRMKDSFLPHNLAICAYDFFYTSIISRIFTFSLMERTSRLLLGSETLPASILLPTGAIVTVNKGFLNTNTATTRQLMRTARTIKAKWRQLQRGRAGRGTKEDE